MKGGGLMKKKQNIKIDKGKKGFKNIKAIIMQSMLKGKK